MNDADHIPPRERRRQRRRARRQKTVNLLPSMLTLGNIACGLLSIVYSTGAGMVDVDFRRACWFIVLGGIFDISDGRVARLTHSESAFGKELDSLSDIVTFGVAPAFLVYSFFGFQLPTGLGLELHPTVLNRLARAALLLLPCAGAVRLARYNLLPSSPSFTGLPIPAAAGTLTAMTLVGVEYPAARDLLETLAMPATVLVSWLMVSRVQYPKHGILRVPRAAVPPYLFLFSTFIVLLAIDISLMLLAIGVAYIGFGLLNHALGGKIALPAMREENDDSLPGATHDAHHA